MKAGEVITLASAPGYTHPSIKAMPGTDRDGRGPHTRAFDRRRQALGMGGRMTRAEAEALLAPAVAVSHGNVDAVAWRQSKTFDRPGTEKPVFKSGISVGVKLALDVLQRAGVLT